MRQAVPLLLLLLSRQSVADRMIQTSTGLQASSTLFRVNPDAVTGALAVGLQTFFASNSSVIESVGGVLVSLEASSVGVSPILLNTSTTRLSLAFASGTGGGYVSTVSAFQTSGGLFQPDTAVAGSWLKNVGQLQQSASVDLSPTQQYLVLIQADASQPTSALYKLESAGANSLGLPGGFRTAVHLEAGNVAVMAAFTGAASMTYFAQVSAGAATGLYFVSKQVASRFISTQFAGLGSDIPPNQLIPAGRNVSYSLDIDGTFGDVVVLAQAIGVPSFPAVVAASSDEQATFTFDFALTPRTTDFSAGTSSAIGLLPLSASGAADIAFAVPDSLGLPDNIQIPAQRSGMLGPVQGGQGASQVFGTSAIVPLPGTSPAGGAVQGPNGQLNINPVQMSIGTGTPAESQGGGLFATANTVPNQGNTGSSTKTGDSSTSGSSASSGTAGISIGSSGLNGASDSSPGESTSSPGGSASQSAESSSSSTGLIGQSDPSGSSGTQTAGTNNVQGNANAEAAGTSNLAGSTSASGSTASGSQDGNSGASSNPSGNSKPGNGAVNAGSNPGNVAGGTGGGSSAQSGAGGTSRPSNSPGSSPSNTGSAGSNPPSSNAGGNAGSNPGSNSANNPGSTSGSDPGRGSSTPGGTSSSGIPNGITPGNTTPLFGPPAGIRPGGSGSSSGMSSGGLAGNPPARIPVTGGGGGGGFLPGPSGPPAPDPLVLPKFPPPPPSPPPKPPGPPLTPGSYWPPPEPPRGGIPPYPRAPLPWGPPHPDTPPPDSASASPPPPPPPDQGGIIG